LPISFLRVFFPLLGAIKMPATTPTATPLKTPIVTFPAVFIFVWIKVVRFDTFKAFRQLFEQLHFYNALRTPIVQKSLNISDKKR
jgi:hypothetical protein